MNLWVVRKLPILVTRHCWKGSIETPSPRHQNDKFRKSFGEVGSWYGNWSQRKALWELWRKMNSYTILMSCDWYLSTVVLYSGHTDLKITYSDLFGTYTVLHTAVYTHACFRNTHFECYMACDDMTIRLVL